MNIKFIEENPIYYPRWVGYPELPRLVFGQIYECNSALTSQNYYNIDGYYYPKTWFEIS